MTLDELNNIASEVQRTKELGTIPSLKEMLAAFGRQSRTVPAMQIINKWLEEKRLKTNIVLDVNAPLYTPIKVSFVYRITHHSFQLYSLWIEKFRNLRDFSIKFDETEHYCTLVGLNGSGKSNVLEAISAIFSHLYREKPAPFNYRLSYIMGGEYFEIENGKIDGLDVVAEKHMPRNIVASYSGEDDRMWKGYYYPLYREYCSDIGEMTNIAVPEMLFVGKDQWDIAFLTLLYARSTNPEIDQFVKSIIGDNKCVVKLKFSSKYQTVWKETIGKRFVRSLQERDDYNEEQFISLITERMSYVDTPSTLFNLMYQASVKDGVSPIEAIDILIPGHGSLSCLSEGEKKMIVVNTIINILATERSLCIFDEPDSHVHVSRKTELLSLIDAPNRYSLLTTHSPVFLDDEKINNIRYINDGKIVGTDRLQIVRQLSGGSISLIDAAYVIGMKKRILLTEGSYDKKYLEKAISVLSEDRPEYKKISEKVTIIKTGGTGDTESTYEELVEQIIDDLDKVIFLFDYDSGGKAGVDHVHKIQNKNGGRWRNKIGYVFYQDNYSTDYDPKQIKGDGSNSFIVEDMFDPMNYEDAIRDVVRKRSHKDFRCVNQRTSDKIKKYIEDHYCDFDYGKYKPLLDKLMVVFGL